LPEEGTFEFDYMSNARPPENAVVLTDFLWEATLARLYDSVCTPHSKISVLRSIAHNFWITSLHMRQLIGFFRLAEHRCEVFIIFYLRIVDMYNAKLFRVRFENQEELNRLQHRLGYASFFPFIQPENARFELDLSCVDQRMCASNFVALSLKESPHNIRDPRFFKENGIEDPLPLGIPRSWADLKKIPTSGTFSGLYVCAPEHRNFEMRKELASTYGYFETRISNEEVNWWTGLTEAPAAVLDFLEFLIGRVPSVQKAFKMLDGPCGNGVVTLRELEEGIEEMGCKWADDKPKIMEVFRYLDPGGEGSISSEEFEVLNQIWKELDLSIREFTQFLCLMFGDDLEECWDAMDDDMSGEMDLEEWLHAVDRIGYFGPAKIVFSLLDSSDDGSISIDEFKVLAKYKKKKSRRQSYVGVLNQFGRTQ
jgi:Ca2+-binding EF-hand superfamily protein